MKKLILVILFLLTIFGWANVNDNVDNKVIFVYDVNEGNSLGIEKQTFSKDELSKDFQLPVPVRESYDFEGWLYNGEVLNNFDDLTGRINLVTVWEETSDNDQNNDDDNGNNNNNNNNNGNNNTYHTVKYYTNGGTEIDDQNILAIYKLSHLIPQEKVIFLKVGI